MVESGDFVRDPMDGELREVSHVWGKQIFLTDGGVMDADEEFEVLLPSEVIT